MAELEESHRLRQASERYNSDESKQDEPLSNCFCSSANGLIALLIPIKFAADFDFSLRLGDDGGEISISSDSTFLGGVDTVARRRFWGLGNDSILDKGLVGSTVGPVSSGTVITVLSLLKRLLSAVAGSEFVTVEVDGLPPMLRWKI